MGHFNRDGRLLEFREGVIAPAEARTIERASLQVAAATLSPLLTATVACERAGISCSARSSRSPFRHSGHQVMIRFHILLRRCPEESSDCFDTRPVVISADSPAIRDILPSEDPAAGLRFSACLTLRKRDATRNDLPPSRRLRSLLPGGRTKKQHPSPGRPSAALPRRAAPVSPAPSRSTPALAHSLLALGTRLQACCS